MNSSTVNSTSSETGTLYFAFGSNLSPTQMCGRLPSHPSSSIPIAITRLDGWKWIICERGYANLVELPHPPASITEQPVFSLSSDPDFRTVWGVLYNLTPEDEQTLDRYEGHDTGRNPHPKVNPDQSTRNRKPYLQGEWDYNKFYLPFAIAQWLVDPTPFGIPSSSSEVKALVYIDELRIEEGTIVPSYIGRMNRAIDEGVSLGVPKNWCEKIMRKWVPAGVYPPESYFGTPDGYVEGEREEEFVKVNGVYRRSAIPVGNEASR